MLYLIHEAQRKNIVDKYYTQVWKSLLWVCCIVCLILAVLAVPTIILLQTEVSVTTDTIKLLETEIAEAESKDFEGKVAEISHKIDILKNTQPTRVYDIYQDITKIVQSVPGVYMQSVVVDTAQKNIQLVTRVSDKEVAKKLVDTLQKTSYTGAAVSYSVLSEKASFIFAQNLSYE